MSDAYIMSRFNKLAKMHKATIETQTLRMAELSAIASEAEPDEAKDISSIFGIDLHQGIKTHLSKVEIVEIKSAEQPVVEAMGATVRPRGLWYGCGSDWLSFADGAFEKYEDGVSYLYKIEPSESVLRISNEDDFKTFYWHFSEPVKVGSQNNPIDWQAVASEYSGIEICPYLWSMRQEYDWYYGWDVASGCIWRPDGVKSIDLIAKRD
jgi:hypothetical protein